MWFYPYTAKCPSAPTPAAQEIFSVYCNPLRFFFFFLFLRGPYCICVQCQLCIISAEQVCCVRFIAKVHLKFVERAVVTSVVDVDYDSTVLHRQHVFLLLKLLLCPSQEEGETSHWPVVKSMLGFCQVTDNLEESPIK